MMGDRRRRDGSGNRRLGAGFVVLVGFSGAMLALQAGAGLPAVGLAALAGCLVGAALLGYLLWLRS